MGGNCGTKFMNLKLANTDAGRFLLGIKDNRKIVKLTPNSYHLQNDERSVTAIFYTYNFVERKLQPIIDKIDIADDYIENEHDAFLHYSGLEEKHWKYPHVYLATDTFNSDTGGHG